MFHVTYVKTNMIVEWAFQRGKSEHDISHRIIILGTLVYCCREKELVLASYNFDYKVELSQGSDFSYVEDGVRYHSQG